MATESLVHNKYLRDSDTFYKKVENLHQKDNVSFMVTRIAGVGDVLSTLPVVYTLQKYWENVSGTLIVDADMNLGSLLSDESFKLIEIERSSGLGGILKQWFTIHDSEGLKPDLYIDLTQSQRSYYYAWFANAYLSIGFKKRFLHRYALDGAVDRAQTKFEGDVMLDPLRLIGIDGDLEWHFSPPKAARQSYRKWIDGTKLDHTSDWLVLNPGASVEVKRWDEVKWCSLIKELAKSTWNGQFVLLEGPSEPGIGKRIFDEIPPDIEPQKKIIINKNRPLEEVAHVISNSSGIISNDTSFYHMGLALDQPTFCIFNNADPFRYRLNKDSVSYTYNLRSGEPTESQVLHDVKKWLKRNDMVS
jgi:ADP-heptose:LPS heptosyltransferase